MEGAGRTRPTHTWPIVRGSKFKLLFEATFAFSRRLLSRTSSSVHRTRYSCRCPTRISSNRTAAATAWSAFLFRASSCPCAPTNVPNRKAVEKEITVPAASTTSRHSAALDSPVILRQRQPLTLFMATAPAPPAMPVRMTGRTAASTAESSPAYPTVHPTAKPLVRAAKMTRMIRINACLYEVREPMKATVSSKRRHYMARCTGGSVFSWDFFCCSRKRSAATAPFNVGQVNKGALSK